MRIILAALAAAVMLAATAAEGADKSAPPVRSMMDPPAEGTVHDGAYVGLAAGYLATVLDAGSGELGSADPVIGIYGGYGRAVQGLYWGLEADAMLTSVSARIGAEDFTVTGKNDYLASLRLRIGLPMGLAMPYVTAGAAYTSARIGVSDGLDSASRRDGLFGIVAGGGLELALTERSALRVEGLYYAFPDQSLRFDGDRLELEQSLLVGRAGFAVKF